MLYISKLLSKLLLELVLRKAASMLLEVFLIDTVFPVLLHRYSSVCKVNILLPHLIFLDPGSRLDD